MILRVLKSEERGSAAVEMAVALPVLVVLLWGIFQVGIALQAIAGMQHALGEGARYATLCLTPNPITGCATPTDAQIKTRIQEKVFGTRVGTFDEPVVSTPASTVCTHCRQASVTFRMPMSFVLFNGPSIDITRSKLIYLA